MAHLTEYEKQARDFLKRNGATLTISAAGIVNGFPFDSRDHQNHNKYIVKIRRGGKSYQFPFYDSAANTWSGQRPGAYDVLACVEKSEPYGDVWDFADEYGYTIEDRDSFKKVERIYKECRTQARKINRLFDGCMGELFEIA